MSEPTVSVAEAKARFSELLRRVEMNGQPIQITRRGKVVATLAPLTEEARSDWVSELRGLFANHPEACDEIDKVYADRHCHRPRYAEF